MSTNTRLLIVGGPGTGKSTRAEAERKARGLRHVLCTDTALQAGKARGVREHVLYAPSSLDGQWSELSQWVADTWLNIRGPWVLEGVAIVRALSKWHADNPGEPPPCDKVVWLLESHIELRPRQAAMQFTHDSRMSDLLVEWPALGARLERSA